MLTANKKCLVMQKAKNSFKSSRAKATLVQFLQHFIVNNYLWTALQPPVVVLSWPSFHNLITAIRSQFTFNFLRECCGLRRAAAFSTLLQPPTTYFMLIISHSPSTHDSRGVLKRERDSTTSLSSNTPRWVSLSFLPVKLIIATSSLFPLSTEHFSSFAKLIINL